MLSVEFCIRNSEGDTAVVGSSISVVLKSKSDNFEDRYYKITSIERDKIFLDNTFVLDLDEIDDFNVLRLQK